jgi:hypothetical protein
MGLLLIFWLQYVRDAMYANCCLLLYSEKASLPFIVFQNFPVVRDSPLLWEILIFPLVMWCWWHLEQNLTMLYSSSSVDRHVCICMKTTQQVGLALVQECDMWQWLIECYLPRNSDVKDHVYNLVNPSLVLFSINSLALKALLLDDTNWWDANECCWSMLL